MSNSALAGNNPRKILRKHCNHLQTEIALIKKRMKKFEGELLRLRNVEKNGSNEEALREACSFKQMDWKAQDLY